MTSGALTFHAVDAVHVPGRGLIFTGPWPISGVIDQRSGNRGKIPGLTAF
jgi:hypothetical protein